VAVLVRGHACLEHGLLGGNRDERVAPQVTRDRKDDSHSGWWIAEEEGKMMRKLMLGSVLLMALGLPALAAEPVSEMKVASLVSPAKRSACHVVAAHRPLRLLRETMPVEIAAPAESAVRRIATPVRIAPVREAVRANRPVMRAEPIRASRADFGRIERVASQHVSLMVGIGY
jgi:hypothetical protein